MTRRPSCTGANIVGDSQFAIRIDEAFRYTAKEPQLPSTAPLLIVATSGSDWTGDCACPNGRLPFLVRRIKLDLRPSTRRRDGLLTPTCPATSTSSSARRRLGDPACSTRRLETLAGLPHPSPATSSVRRRTRQSTLDPTSWRTARPGFRRRHHAHRLAARHECLQPRLPLLLRAQVRRGHGRDHWPPSAAGGLSAQLHGLRRVKLKYAGGEATLHFRRIRRLHDHAATLAAKASIQLDEVLLTNGTLLRPEDAHWCADQGIRIMVSLDGVGALHDRLRPWPDGRGSFPQVRHAVDELLLPYGIRHISMTVTGINACGAPDMAHWAVVERKLPLNFNLYRSNALSATRAGLACEESAIVKGLLAACAVIEADLPTEPILGGLLDRVQLFTPYACLGAGQNYAVISHDGRLAGCHMRLRNAATECRRRSACCDRGRHDPKWR